LKFLIQPEWQSYLLFQDLLVEEWLRQKTVTMGTPETEA
jgi:hypothetical protein